MVALILALVPTTHSACIALSPMERVSPFFVRPRDVSWSFVAPWFQGTLSIEIIFSSTVSNQKSEIVFLDFAIILSAIVCVVFYEAVINFVALESQRDSE